MSGETEAIEYPPRPKFYANKVTRLLFKTAMANDLGSDVCYMITQIAHQEDAGRYAGPVTFWNEQLMGICGFKNVRALDRARSAAVKAGWLVYIHGGKGKVGKYFTLIPPKYVTYDDGAIDETNIQAELTPPQAVVSEAARQTPDKRQTNAREQPENSQTNVRETPEKCLTFLPNPSPIPNPNTDSCPEAVSPPSTQNIEKPVAENDIPEMPVDTVLTWECSGKVKLWHLTQTQVNEWQVMFPGIDVLQQCRNAKVWGDGKPANRKTASGMKTHLGKWLIKAQNESVRAGPHQQATRPGPTRSRVPTDEERANWRPSGGDE